MRLTATALGCERGGRRVFSSVTFEVAGGELLALTGPNGSGKSSLLRLLAGLGEPAEGAIKLDGGDAELSVGQHCHYVAHQDAIKPALTVAENLKFWAAFLGGASIDSALKALDLARLADYPAALLSAGQKHRLSLARVLVAPRKVWLLDEPTVGLDSVSITRLQALIRDHLSGDGIVIAATHVDLGVSSRSLELAA